VIEKSYSNINIDRENIEHHFIKISEWVERIKGYHRIMTGNIEESRGKEYITYLEKARIYAEKLESKYEIGLIDKL